MLEQSNEPPGSHSKIAFALGSIEPAFCRFVERGIGKGLNEGQCLMDIHQTLPRAESILVQPLCSPGVGLLPPALRV